MLIKSVIALVATSTLAVKLVERLIQQHQRRVRHEGRLHSDDLSRWDAEGGDQPVPQLPAKRRTRAKPKASS